MWYIECKQKLLYTIFVFWILCFIYISGEVQEYHQDDYFVKLDRLEVYNYSRNYFKNLRAEFVWYNRSQRVVNVSFYLLKNLSTDVKVEVQVYKFLSNEYRFFPITRTVNACQYIKTRLLGFQDILRQYSNLRSCPVKPGFYYLRNAVIDFSKFPPFIPSGAYKAAVKTYHRNDCILEIGLFGSAETILKLWKN